MKNYYHQFKSEQANAVEEMLRQNNFESRVRSRK